jgi:hypothetical protein
MLEGRKPQHWRTSFFYHYYDQFGVPEILGLRTEKHKLIQYKSNDRTEWEFYDIKKDPAEMKNQIDNPKFKALIQDLKSKLMEEQGRYDSQSH